MTDFIETDGHDVTDERHRAECAACAAVWTDLERISAEARELPALTPSRDLWAGIDARLADRGAQGAATSATGHAGRAGVVADPATRRGAARRWVDHPTVRLATAASLLVAATAAVTWTLATEAGDAPTRPAAVDVAAASLPVPSDSQLQVAFGAPTAVVAEVHQASVERTVQAMDREIVELQRLLDERRAALDPRTVSVLEESMKLIDKAIADSRQALAADPASGFLAAQYARAYTSKLTLLRDAATLPAGD